MTILNLSLTGFGNRTILFCKRVDSRLPSAHFASISFCVLQSTLFALIVIAAFAGGFARYLQILGTWQRSKFPFNIMSRLLPTFVEALPKPVKFVSAALASMKIPPSMPPTIVFTFVSAATEFNAGFCTISKVSPIKVKLSNPFKSFKAALSLIITDPLERFK